MGMVKRLKSLSRQPLPSFSISLVLVLLAAALVGCTQLPVSTPTPEAQTSLPAAADFTATPQPLSIAFGVPKGPIFLGEQAASLEEAQNRVSFNIAVPRNLPGDYSLIWMGTSPLSSKEEGGGFSRLVYSDGQHHIIVGQRLAKDHEKGILEEDEILTLAYLQKVTIRGYPGMAREGGVYMHPRLGDLKPVPLEVPPYLQWWPPGQTIAIWSEDDMSLRLADLIAMAESVESVR